MTYRELLEKLKELPEADLDRVVMIENNTDRVAYPLDGIGVYHGEPAEGLDDGDVCLWFDY